MLSLSNQKAPIQQTENDTSESWPEEPTEEFTKGKSTKIQLDYIEKELVKLKPYANQKTNTLPSDILNIFDSMKSAVGLLYDTAEYESLYKLVQKTFECGERPVEPGTVLGYFCGCVNANKNTCSIYCVNAMPKPSSANGPTCNDTIITATYDGIEAKFDFLTLTKSKKALIYVQYMDVNKFPGFSLQEIEQLRNKNITEVKLVPFPTLDGTVVENNTNFIPLEELKIRNIKTEPNQAGELSVAAIAIVIFLILIIGIIYIIYSRQ